MYVFCNLLIYLSNLILHLTLKFIQPGDLCIKRMQSYICIPFLYFFNSTESFCPYLLEACQKPFAEDSVFLRSVLLFMHLCLSPPGNVDQFQVNPSLVYVLQQGLLFPRARCNKLWLTHSLNQTMRFVIKISLKDSYSYFIFSLSFILQWPRNHNREQTSSKV